MVQTMKARWLPIINATWNDLSFQLKDFDISRTQFSDSRLKACTCSRYPWELCWRGAIWIDILTDWLHIVLPEFLVVHLQEVVIACLPVRRYFSSLVDFMRVQSRCKSLSNGVYTLHLVQRSRAKNGIWQWLTRIRRCLLYWVTILLDLLLSHQDIHECRNNQ